MNGVHAAEGTEISIEEMVLGNKTSHGFVVLGGMTWRLPQQRNEHLGNGGRSWIKYQEDKS